MHNHTHHSPHHEQASFNSVFAIAISATLIYTLTEAGYGFYVHSLSLLADAIHNLGDVLGLGLAWLANWLLSFSPRKRYSYGFKRTTILAALINAFILVSTSALIAYESIYKLLHLSQINESIVIIIALIGIVVNVGSSLLFMRGAHHDINIKSAFLHLLADALILCGVVISALIMHYTHWLWIDPTVGLLIVVIVLWGTWSLLRDSVILLLDAVPHHIDYAGVKNFLSQWPGVHTVHDLHIWGLSTREVALTAHLIMPEKKLSDADYKTINHVLHEQFRISHATLQIENGSQTDPCSRSQTC
jgi:cobalt-zinc-cadmium efflux system protein